MVQSFKLLLAEDSDDDAELIGLALSDGGLSCVVDRVFDEASFIEALARDPDVIISDYVMPQFDAPRALFLTRQIRPGTPLIVISRAVGEDAAVETMRQGASDYLLKDRLARLPDAVLRALERRRLEAEMQHAEQALSESQEFCREVLKALPMVLAIVDRDGMIKAVNREAPSHSSGRRLMLQTGTKLDHALTGLLASDRAHLAHAQEGIREVMNGGRSQFAADYPIESGDSRHWYSLKASALTMPKGNVVVAFEEITQRKRAEEALRIRDLAVESSNNAIVIVDALAENYPLTYVNPAFLTLTGRSRIDSIGQPLTALMTGTDQPDVWTKVEQALEAKREIRGTLRIIGTGGRPCWCKATLAPVRGEDGVVSHFVGSLVDVTESRNYQEELERRANFDALTSLPNRALCKDRLEQAIQWAQRQRSMVGLVRIDIDRFDAINSSLGYKVGDQVLQHLGERCRERVAQGDTVARVGGDSFLLVLSGMADAAALVEFLDAIRSDIGKPLPIDNQEVLVTASIGAAIFPRDGHDAEALERCAALAAFQVKSAGGNGIRFARPQLTGRLRERLTMQAQLHHAVEGGQFELRYQPIVDQRSGRATGAEALIYWVHPRLGALPPHTFMSTAEDSGILRSISSWALTRVCQQLQAWRTVAPAGFRLALNTAPSTLLGAEFARQVQDSVATAGLDAAALEIEIGAHTVRSKLPDLLGGLDALREVGVQISLDEVGTGSYGLAQLSRLPIDRLKIDRTLISGLPDSHEDRSVISGVVNIAKTLGLATVADGVERKEQLALIGEIGFDEVQGPLHCLPLDAESFLSHWLIEV